jgi:8-oxo-dGTP pyrophosphatase MutT (NUDIX family)
MRQTSLCILIKENEGQILLAMKKRGFGKGRWNGVGGKPDSEKGDKNVLDSAKRESEEEIGVKIQNPEKVAVVDFLFPEVPKEKEFDQQTHIFLIRKWEGEPRESEEMRPKWFSVEDIPFNQMWSDDRHWLPHILAGKKLKGKFIFDGKDKVVNKTLKFVKKLK